MKIRGRVIQTARWKTAAPLLGATVAVFFLAGELHAQVLVTTASLPAGTVNMAYPPQTLTAMGGLTPYTWSIVTGSLPPGLTRSGATISGTPTTAGTFNFTVRVTDSTTPIALTNDKPLSITVNPEPLLITTASLPAGTVGAAYAPQTLTATGGTTPYNWSTVTGSLPPGLNRSGATISGTPTTPGTFNFTVRVTDSATPTPQTNDKALSITVNPAPLSITTTSPLPPGAVGTAYTAVGLAATGGTTPYTWSVATGSLPAGLSLSTAGVLSGTPTAAGAFDFTIQVADSGNQTTTKVFALTVQAQLSITSTSPLPPGIAGTAYPAQTLAATGGVMPYSWSVASGSIPPGLNLSNTGVLSGTPNTAGAFNFTVQVTDSGSPGQTATKALAITINAQLSVTTGSPLFSGAAGITYSQTMNAAGGVTPYTWSVASGSIPPGLNLSDTGVLSGTPTAAGAFNFTVRVGDASGQSVMKAFALTINPPLSITSAPSLPFGVVGVDYPAQTLVATGGVAPYTWSLATGSSLPSGLSLSPAGALSGTPTNAGTFNFTIQVRDTGPPAQTALKTFSITIAPPLAITTSPPLPFGVTGTGYPQQSFAASGGSMPYVWSVASGTLPAGVVLNMAGVLNGTPTAAGTFQFTVRVADSATPQQTATRAFTIVIADPLTITSGSPLGNGAVGVAYSQTLTASGGTLPFSWSVTNGQLPPGVSVSSGGSVSGTPTTAGSFNFTVRASDAANPALATSKNFAITIQVGLTITTAPALPSGVVGATYSKQLEATLSTGLNWTLAGGSLPGGLNLSSAGLISGTPAASGNSSFTVRATGGSPEQTTTQSFTIVINTRLQITTAATLPEGAVASPYSVSLAGSGGVPPYTWSLAQGSSLPPGLALSGAGLINGVPARADVVTFSVQVTDSFAEAQTASRTFTITINSPALSITTASLPNAIQNAPYSQQLQAAGGTPPYTWVLVNGTLPQSLTLNSAGLISGTPTAFGSQDFVIRVADSRDVTTARGFTLLVQPVSGGQFPSISTTLPGNANATQQLPITFTLSAPYPGLLAVQVNLSFSSNAAIPSDDPMTEFSTGSRAVNFTIPANTTSFQTPFSLLLGTVSGTVALTASIQSGPTDVRVGSVSIAPGPPQVTSVSATRASGSLDLRIIGYSPMRRIVGVEFGFDIRTGNSAQRVTLKRSVEPDFTRWYQSSDSSPFGSAFLYVQSFTVQGDASLIEAVTVTLANEQGNVSSTPIRISN